MLSKAMKHVDEETRREFREKRLQSLECDNYVETETAPVDDDAYNESDVSGIYPTFPFWKFSFYDVYVYRRTKKADRRRRERRTKRILLEQSRNGINVVCFIYLFSQDRLVLFPALCTC